MTIAVAPQGKNSRDNIELRQNFSMCIFYTHKLDISMKLGYMY